MLASYIPPESFRSFVANIWTALVASGAVFCTAITTTATTIDGGVNWLLVWATTGAAFFGVLASATERGIRAARSGLSQDVLTTKEQDIINRLRSGDIIFDADADPTTPE